MTSIQQQESPIPISSSQPEKAPEATSILSESGPVSTQTLMTYRDNTVYFKNQTDFTVAWGTYTLTDYSITPGQDPQGKIRVGQEHTWSDSDNWIAFSIGRSGSGTVADWWSANIPSNANTFDHGPTELNFALLGTMVLTLTGGSLGNDTKAFTLNDIALAQGHVKPASNNWWFGGKDARYVGGSTVRCSGTNPDLGTWTFYFERGHNDGYAVDVVTLFMIENS